MIELFKIRYYQELILIKKVINQLKSKKSSINDCKIKISKNNLIFLYQ